MSKSAAGQAGAIGGRDEYHGPDSYLDYDPMPYELALRASYAEQALRSRHAAEKAQDGLDGHKARVKLFGGVQPSEKPDLTEHD